jgi:hypothetical protein
VLSSYPELRNKKIEREDLISTNYDGQGKIIVTAVTKRNITQEVRNKELKERCYSNDFIFKNDPFVFLFTIPFGILQGVLDILFFSPGAGCRNSTTYTSWEQQLKPTDTTPYVGKINLTNDDNVNCLALDANRKDTNAEGKAVFYLRHKAGCVTFNSNGPNSSVEETVFTATSDNGAERFNVSYKKLDAVSQANKEKVCPVCGRVFPNNAKFCGYDGAKLR